ncbi:uncharacterized protein LOC124532463, partial [Vanessa cardui]|uniref:uncharacterized protein LOC124532463 n=1 Tax=Vanessa cardui TaxID=171605 RepID=UPI001F138CFE
IKRSVSEDDTKFKPFWQIDGFTNKPQLKSMKYTTLANKKIRISKRTTSKQKMLTEHITLKSSFDQKENRKPVSEKYLSFDELMHLRKFNTGNFSGRRLHDINSEDDEGKQSLRKAASETTESTSEYTANTPFIRLKHCTRKLTCTWTAASLTDSAGSVIPGGAGGAAGHMGSRTPPGYVEGCTRTSTCTRDYMNRNKMATLPVETTSPEFDSGDEEDYCERRSLNRRHSNKTVSIKMNDLYNKSHSRQNPLNINPKNYGSNVNETFVDCNCYQKKLRNKRNGLINKRLEETILNYRNRKRENIKYKTDYSNDIISYGDLYYSVLKKILNTWKSKKPLHSSRKFFYIV